MRDILFSNLPLEKASELYELYTCHVKARIGSGLVTQEERTYRKLLEFEETLLQWDEIRVYNGFNFLCEEFESVFYFPERGRRGRPQGVHRPPLPQDVRGGLPWPRALHAVQGPDACRMNCRMS